MRFLKTIILILFPLIGIALGLWSYIFDHSLVTSIPLLALLLLQTASILPVFDVKASLLSEETSTAESVLEALAGGVIKTDKAGKVLYLNKSAEKLLARSNNKVLSQPIEQVLNLEDNSGKPLIPKVMEQHKAQPKYLLQFGQVKLQPEAGEPYFVELHTTCLEDDSLVFIFRDVNADRKVINRLYQQAANDDLTGLMNRRSFEECVEQIAHDESGVARTHVLAAIDLDNFKIVNDTCGHQAGDELLKQIAQVFLNSVRKSDKVARMGGDEFAILLEGCNAEIGRKVMDSVLIAVRNYRFSWEGKVFNISASIGLIEFIPAADVAVKVLFANADKACYTAKALGRNQTFVQVNIDTVYHSEPQRTDWGKLLEKAIEYDRFILFVQPIVPLQKECECNSVHYEVLLRLPFRKNLLSPGSFLPSADRLDMMSRIDRWIIGQVFSTVAKQKLHSRLGFELRLMINLSSQAVQDPDLFAYIETNLKQYQVDPRTFCFEIAESVAIANFMQAKRLMKSLDALGCHLALDDFGSGFSALNYVRELPLSYLKIDGNFIHNLVSNEVDAAMVKAVHEVGQVMQLITIAELVEDKETLDCLRSIGLDFAQGYYCGKPFPFLHLCEAESAFQGNILNSNNVD